MARLSAANFFTTEEKGRIEAAVREAESRTSGEIVPMVVDQSYGYPRAEIIGAGLFSLATGVFLSWAFGGESIWVFLAVFFLAYFPFKFFIRAVPALKRGLISSAEIAEEVEEKALVSFVERGLHHTRDETGVLILISLFEKQVHVLADRGINEVVPPHTWEEIVKTVTDGIHAGRTCDAIEKAVRRCGDLLEKNFPIKKDDTDELPNLILE